ncbi:hypothetical protein QAD02_023258 [Eretmocerus hayati]|uniref:Uncharacterized protein n=1 Tax=Eretmocerus hayati TaxID=131215 RepID=A0ACC2PVZ8_9HYME|nr:hypothetical protein QAD02_023258 [Eretmocerus hayati]
MVFYRGTIASLFLLFLAQVCYCRLDGVDILIRHLKSQETVNSINIIMKSRGTSVLYSSLAKRMINEFANTVTYFMDPKTIEDQCFSNEDMMQILPRRPSMRIGIIDLQNQVDAHKELLEMFAFFLHQDRSSTRKYMILLLNSQNSTFEAFLRHVWDERILDLTVIEWIGEDLGENLNLLRLDKQGDEIYVHVFNPFYDSYSKEELTPEATLFPDKLKDLNSFPINMRLFDLNPAYDFESKSDMDESLTWQGFTVSLSVVMSKMMNFEPVLRYAHRSHEIFNESNRVPIPYEKALELGLLDYISNFDLVGIGKQFVLAEKKCFKSLHHSAFMTIPLDELQILLVVEQYNSPKTEVSFTFVITFIVFFIIGSIFLVVAQLFKLDANNWTILNTMLMLVGGPVDAHVPMRVPERILRVSLYLASGLVALFTTDAMMTSLRGHQQFIDFKSMHDLANSDIKLYSLEVDKIFLSKLPDFPDLQTIVNRTVIYSNDYESVRPPWTNANESQYAILSIGIFGSGIPVTSSFVGEDDRGMFRLASVINEPLGTSPITLYSNTSPFLIDRFQKLTTLLSETGLLKYWYELNDYSKEFKSFNLSSRIPLYAVPSSVGYVDIIYNEPLYSRLAVILIVGYSLAGITLIFEIIWAWLGLDVQHSNYLMWMILCGKSNRGSTKNSMITGSDRRPTSLPQMMTRGQPKEDLDCLTICQIPAEQNQSPKNYANDSKIFEVRKLSRRSQMVPDSEETTGDWHIITDLEESSSGILSSENNHDHQEEVQANPKEDLDCLTICQIPAEQNQSPKNYANDSKIFEVRKLSRRSQMVPDSEETTGDWHIITDLEESSSGILSSENNHDHQEEVQANVSEIFGERISPVGSLSIVSCDVDTIFD